MFELGSLQHSHFVHIRKWLMSVFIGWCNIVHFTESKSLADHVKPVSERVLLWALCALLVGLVAMVTVCFVMQKCKSNISGIVLLGWNDSWWISVSAVNTITVCKHTKQCIIICQSHSLVQIFMKLYHWINIFVFKPKSSLV